MSYSPMLADRLAANTENGIDHVAASIVKAIMYPRSGSSAVEAPTLAGRLVLALESTPQPSATRDFLMAHPLIVGQAFGPYGRKPDIRGAVRLGSFELDLCVRLQASATTRTYRWVLVQLESPSQPLFEDGASTVERRVSELEELRQWASQNLAKARRRLPKFDTTFNAVVVAGRRALLNDSALDGLRLYNEELAGITLRTYDWLLDAAVSLE